MFKLLLAVGLSGSIAYADVKPVCSQVFQQAAERSRYYYMATDTGSLLLFGGGLFGVFKRGWRWRGLGALMGSAVVGALASLEGKHTDFLKALAKSVAEAEKGEVGPYTRVLAQFLNSAIYDKTLFVSELLGTQTPLSKPLRAELASALGNQRMTPDDIIVVTQKLLDTDGFCLPINAQLAATEWVEMMVWGRSTHAAPVDDLTPATAPQ